MTEIPEEYTNGTPRFELKPSIKLSKMSKGYNWEIRVINLDIDELERINTEMMKRFGGLE